MLVIQVLGMLQVRFYPKPFSPSSSLPHDVAVEWVEDTFVGQLQRVEKDFLAFGRLEPSGVTGRGGIRHLFLGNLAKT